jgi:hypothetical protein
MFKAELTSRVKEKKFLQSRLQTLFYHFALVRPQACGYRLSSVCSTAHRL